MPTASRLTSMTENRWEETDRLYFDIRKINSVWNAEYCRSSLHCFKGEKLLIWLTDKCLFIVFFKHSKVKALKPSITRPWRTSCTDDSFDAQEHHQYRKTSNISHTLVGNKIVDHSDVVGAPPVGAAPTTPSFAAWHLASRDLAKTATRQYENLLSVVIWGVLYQRLDGNVGRVAKGYHYDHWRSFDKIWIARWTP